MRIGPASQGLLLLATVGAAGCISLPQTPAYPTDDQAFPPPEEVAPEGVATDDPQPLRVLPGDDLTLHAVSAETTEYPGLVVDELGQLHVPLAGDVRVGGMTLSEAETQVQQALRRFDTVVVANLFVADAAGHRATIVGAVNTPGRVQVPPGTRLADLLAMAGGPVTEVSQGEQMVLADLHGARLVRNQEVVPVSLPLALQGDPRHNVRVRSGDHLYIPPTRGQRVTVLGEVHTPAVVPYREGVRLTEALAMAGGVTIDGDYADVRVIRGPSNEPRVYTTSMVDIVNGRSYDVVLAPGDVVFVTEHWIASVGEVLDRLGPLLSTGTTVGLAVLVTR